MYSEARFLIDAYEGIGNRSLGGLAGAEVRLDAGGGAAAFGDGPDDEGGAAAGAG